MRTDFAELTAVCFDIPLHISRKVYEPEPAWQGAYRGFAGVVDGRVVSIVALVASGTEIGIYSLATLPGQRRNGYGEALMRGALQAFAPTHQGPLVLQSTHAGHTLYESMGFRDTAKFRIYLTYADSGR